MTRATGFTLLAIVLGSGCGYRPCAEGPTRLLGALVSQATPEQVKAALRPAAWVVEADAPGPTDGRPPFAFTTVGVGDVGDLGQRGHLKLVFYNGRLSSALFTPSDPYAYFSAVQALPGAIMRAHGVVSLGSNTRVWRLGGSREGPVIEWYDACLRADQDSWIARYAWATGLPNNAMQLTKLRAAPVQRAEVPPCAPAGRTDGGTASQLIASVRRTIGVRGEANGAIGHTRASRCPRAGWVYWVRSQ